MRLRQSNPLTVSKGHVVSHLRCYISQIGKDCSKLLGMKTMLKLPALFQIDL